jgi:hypothetical protein
LFVCLRACLFVFFGCFFKQFQTPTNLLPNHLN